MDNLKVFLTLKYQDVGINYFFIFLNFIKIEKLMINLQNFILDPEIFDVYFNNKRLNPEEVIFRTGLQDGSKVVIKPKVSSCCVIF